MESTLLTEDEIERIREARRLVDLPGDDLSQILKAQDAKTRKAVEAQMERARIDYGALSW